MSAHAQQSTPAESFGLVTISPDEIPERHPVAIFARRYSALEEGMLLPHENDLIEDPDMQGVLDYAQHLEPIELEGAVDFYVLSQGDKLPIKDDTYINDGWMSDTVDPEFADSRYHEVIAAAVLRRPMFSKGATPSRERAFRMLLRGVFPVFAENRARLRLISVSAEPYIELRAAPRHVEAQDDLDQPSIEDAIRVAAQAAVDRDR